MAPGRRPDLNVEDTVDSQVPRRSVLGGLGLAGAGLVAGSALAPAAYAGPAAPAAGPFDLHFGVAAQYRKFALLAPDFVQYDTALEPGAARAATTLVRTGARPRAPFAAVLLRVESVDADAGVVAGLVRDAGNSVLVGYDAAAKQVTIEVTVGGTTTVVGEAPADLRAPFGLAVVVNENAVTALVDTTSTGAAWTPLVSRRDEVAALVDLRDPAVLGQHTYGYGGRGAGAAVIGRAQAGYFGQAGLRDPHVVQHADGRPYVRDGRLFLTFTMGGLGFFQQAHWRVWSLDLADPTSSDALRHEAQLFFSRDGVVLGDHAGQIVRDDRTGRWILAMSSWGDFAFTGVHVRHVATRADVLSGVHVLPTERLALPTAMSAWDPAFTRIGDRWHVAYVESPAQQPAFVFHPAIAVGPAGADYPGGLTLAGADPSVDQTEGTILQRVGGRWYLLASDGDARRYKIYDLRARLLGTLDAPYRTNIPHPQIVPVPAGRGENRWLLVTFDGTQYAEPALGYGTHGDVLVMTQRG